ncbi:MAG: polysaccharide deacetylase family protein [Turneriella sp.]|nr:polysaccharide deacetylase family protein [Turneriella sp.]
MRRTFLILSLIFALRCKSKEQTAAPIPPHLQKAVVLCFHDITPGAVRKGISGRYSVSLTDFREILDALSTYKIVSLRDWVEAKDPNDTRPRVVLTFDDGYAAHRELVLPELRRRQIGATFFFYADALRRDKKWYLLAANEQAFDFGSHSWSHALLKDVGYDELFKELYLARGFLETATHKEIKSFAWPYGYYNPDALRAARSAGFAYQVSVDYRVATRDDIAKIIPRYTVFGKEPVAQVRQILGEFRAKMPQP